MDLLLNLDFCSLVFSKIVPGCPRQGSAKG